MIPEWRADGERRAGYFLNRGLRGRHGGRGRDAAEHAVPWQCDRSITPAAVRRLPVLPEVPRNPSPLRHPRFKGRGGVGNCPHCQGRASRDDRTSAASSPSASQRFKPTPELVIGCIPREHAVPKTGRGIRKSLVEGRVGVRKSPPRGATSGRNKGVDAGCTHPFLRGFRLPDFIVAGLITIQDSLALYFVMLADEHYGRPSSFPGMIMAMLSTLVVIQ